MMGCAEKAEIKLPAVVIGKQVHNNNCQYVLQIPTWTLYGMQIYDDCSRWNVGDTVITK